jgi:hypothetical protein
MFLILLKLNIFTFVMIRRLNKISSILAGLILILLSVYLSSCDSKTGITSPPPPPPIDTNHYGSGNGKITFFRTEQIPGPVVIKVSASQMTDSIVWQVTPDCDSNVAVSKILRAGDYTVSIEGSVFLCNYNVTVEEKKCKLLNYTNCNNGYVGCYTLNGTWLRTADGPCPNCKGLKVQFTDGMGEVIFTPQGCRFPLGDIKWTDFNPGNCTVYDMARDDYGGSPEYQLANLIFYNKDSLSINGPSGVIPYSRIANTNVKTHKKKNIVVMPGDVTDKSAKLPVQR